MYRLASLILVLTLTSVSGCVTTSQRAALQADATVTNICKLFPNISYDGSRDTQLTKDQIKRFNRARMALCKGDKK